MNAPQRQPVDMTGQKKMKVGMFGGDAQKGQPASQETLRSIPEEKFDVTHAEERPSAVEAPREDFKDVFTIQAEMVEKNKAAANAMMNRKNRTENDVDSLNKALGGNNNSELDDIIKISKEDIALCEQLIFNGFAETHIEMKSFPGRKFTICSTNAEELNFIDEIIFEKIRSVKQNDDGSVEMPENSIKALRNALFISLSYRGFDNKDICIDPISHLSTIKRAIIKLGEFSSLGDIKKADELKTSIKNAIMKRVAIVKRISTPLLDWITSQKYNMDVTMLKIMNEKGVISL
jgi:hypothetical protein